MARPEPLLLALALAGCAAAPQCPQGSQAAVLDQLYFGASRPHGPDLTPQEWSAFVHDEIAPRFPQGFTVLEAQGQWRNADGSLAQERSRVLQLAHPADAAGAAALGEIAQHYRARFGQEAVLQIGAPACITLYR
jgi:hypothetical protein